MLRSGRIAPAGIALVWIAHLAFCQRGPAGPALAPMTASPSPAVERPLFLPTPTEPPLQPVLLFQWGFHDHPLRMAWSPRRSWLALASSDRLYVYHFPSLRLLAFFAVEERLRELAFAADGVTLVGRTEGGTLRAWEIPSRRERWSRIEPLGLGLATAPSAPWLATGHEEGFVRLLDLMTGEGIRWLPGSVPSSFSPDGRRLITCSRPAGSEPLRVGCAPDADWLVVEVTSGQVRSMLPSVAPPIWAADGGRVIVGRADGTVREVDLSTGAEEILWHRPGARIHRLSLSTDGRWLAIEHDGSVDIVMRATGEVRWSEVGGPMAFSPVGSHLAWVRGRPPRLFLLDLKTGAERALPADVLETHRPLQLSFSLNGRWLMLQAEEARGFGAPVAQIWDVATGAERFRFSPRLMPIWDIAFSPDGKVLGAIEGTVVRLYDLEAGQERGRLPLRTAEGWSLAFSPDGRRLAVGLADGRIRLYGRAAGRGWMPERDLVGHEGAARGLAFSPDGRLFASASWDRTVRVWEVEPGRERMRLEGYAAEVWDVAFSPDGQTLVSAGGDGTLDLGWETAAGGQRLPLTVYGVRIYRVAFSPDGRWLAAGLEDGTVRVWDAIARYEHGVLRVGARPVRALDFSPDGRWLAAGDAEGRVVLWAMPDGAERLRWERAGDAVYGLAFAPDGARLALGFRSGVVQVWEIR
ncbi:WD40 repeat domain-containing protein [Thermoflexus sp.]|uniref:WD40 repeat domain-containing protein n=2 Tax=Thermoflexus sp. TaxID=1969742 RepID=UPI0025DC0837|nr:WD40 repeat domain-containing protein [Thermoflexus sp.]MDW8181765.1 WD40 repeat domain-containing protein [Anaerolineae bacterium]MCS6962699.1 WD40 repeat domain-containing protein [Thermoflexus sp.]MCS7352302.1 WD40 repeat domain-containing protein [Thermoflexus sp.]MCX7691620.1 WD40 repeat domain-containing protein [Thermoflexus sp.]MDW8185514.1 WD40 repeat domain-containing protein [Anaerolineae bacterium]